MLHHAFLQPQFHPPCGRSPPLLSNYWIVKGESIFSPKGRKAGRGSIRMGSLSPWRSLLHHCRISPLMSVFSYVLSASLSLSLSLVSAAQTACKPRVVPCQRYTAMPKLTWKDACVADCLCNPRRHAQTDLEVRLCGSGSSQQRQQGLAAAEVMVAQLLQKNIKLSRGINNKLLAIRLAAVLANGQAFQVET